MFDSGLGGLTVLRSLIDLLPGEPFTYFGDTGRFPYGPRPAAEVLGFSLEIADLLVDAGARLLIVACNSATGVALDTLEDRYAIPVVGVVEPGVRAAASATRTGRVGVIGTTGTIASGAYQRAAGRRGLELTAAACPGFVEFVEAGDVDSPEVHALARELLAPVRDAGVDTLILGCTHYPLLARTISDVMGRDVVLVSSADETAFEVRRLVGTEAPAARNARSGRFHAAGGNGTATGRGNGAGSDGSRPARWGGALVPVAPAAGPATAGVTGAAATAGFAAAGNGGLPPPAGNGRTGSHGGRGGRDPLHRFITSGDPGTFRRLGGRFCGPEVEHVETWTWT